MDSGQYPGSIWDDLVAQESDSSEMTSSVSAGGDDADVLRWREANEMASSSLASPEDWMLSESNDDSSPDDVWQCFANPPEFDAADFSTAAPEATFDVPSDSAAKLAPAAAARAEPSRKKSKSAGAAAKKWARTSVSAMAELPVSDLELAQAQNAAAAQRMTRGRRQDTESAAVAMGNRLTATRVREEPAGGGDMGGGRIALSGGKLDVLPAPIGIPQPHQMAMQSMLDLSAYALNSAIPVAIPVLEADTDVKPPQLQRGARGGTWTSVAGTSGVAGGQASRRATNAPGERGRLHAAMLRQQTQQHELLRAQPLEGGKATASSGIRRRAANLGNNKEHLVTSKLTIDVSKVEDDGSIKFVDFIGRDGKSIGSISQDKDNVGITIEGQSGDFAEWHRRAAGEPECQEGDVVGFTDGLLTRNTARAQMAGIISKRALIKGSRPESEDLPLYETVAYCGQVPVRVRMSSRRVKAGDVVVSSGRGDGTAIVADHQSWWKRVYGPKSFTIGVTSKQGAIHLAEKELEGGADDMQEPDGISMAAMGNSLQGDLLDNPAKPEEEEDVCLVMVHVINPISSSAFDDNSCAWEALFVVVMLVFIACSVLRHAASVYATSAEQVPLANANHGDMSHMQRVYSLARTFSNVNHMYRQSSSTALTLMQPSARALFPGMSPCPQFVLSGFRGEDLNGVYTLGPWMAHGRGVYWNSDGHFCIMIGWFLPDTPPMNMYSDAMHTWIVSTADNFRTNLIGGPFSQVEAWMSRGETLAMRGGNWSQSTMQAPFQRKVRLNLTCTDNFPEDYEDAVGNL